MLLVGDSEPWSSVVGVDPGGTTGLFAVKLGGGSRLSDCVQVARGAEVFAGQQKIDTREKGMGAPLHIGEARLQRLIAGRLIALAEQWRVDCLHLAVEDFVVRERTTDRSLLSPVRMTSGILALLEESDMCFVVHFNSASDAKSTVSDEVLKKLGLYAPGKPHAMDAARHALLVLRKELF